MRVDTFLIVLIRRHRNRLATAVGFILLLTLFISSRSSLSRLVQKEIVYDLDVRQYAAETTLYFDTLSEGVNGSMRFGHARIQTGSCDGRMIAMGIAVSLRGKHSIASNNIVPLIGAPFFKLMLPTFLDTASARYCYRFYVAYDFNDPVLSQVKGRNAFTQSFAKIFNEKSPFIEIEEVELRFVHCNHTHSPAWAQNDAMMAAYSDNVTYLYMVNDDTRFMTSHWGQYLTHALQTMDPANVGISGPNHIGGNLKVLTYNFVHRTHIDIFGYFYPRDFHDWGADTWITKIYQPNNSKKLAEVVVDHVMNVGTRYEPTHNYSIELVIQNTRGRLKKYIENLTYHRQKLQTR